MKMLLSLQKQSAILMALLLGFTLVACNNDDDDGPTLSREAQITQFIFTSLTPPDTATISGTNITASVPAGTDVTALTPTITVSTGASVQPASGTARDFTNPVTYTVTAEDGTQQTYTVTVTVEAPPEVSITPIWQRNLVSGGLPSWFTANNDRDITAFGDFVFVHNNNDKIRVVAAATGADVAAGDTTFIDGRQNFSGGNINLLGMDTDSQGRIVASNMRIGSDALNPWNVYVWNNKDADQELLFAYPTPAGSRVGDNLTVKGDVRGTAQVYAPVSGAQTNFVLKFSISGGQANTTPQVITLQGLTGLGNAADVHPVSNDANANLIVAGTGVAGIAEYSQNGTLVGRLPESLKTGETAMLFSFALDVEPFELRGRKLIATTASDFVNTASATSGFLYIIDYTDGWENLTPAQIKRVPFTPAGNIDTNNNGTGGVSVIVNGDEAVVYAMITNYGIGAYRVRF